MKIIAVYLPQFHEIPENNEWWGKGFTEWLNVKTAKPTFKGQYQPRIPLNRNYYDTTNVDTLIWQAELAKQYGIYGFCYYHYWFEGKLLLEKPAEIMLNNRYINIPFCFSWANHTWTKVWADKEEIVLLKQTYGNVDDWTNHFNYLLPFFKDGRYIKENGKPIMIIYRPNDIKTCEEMLLLWKKLAFENGLPGIVFVNQENSYDHNKEKAGYLFDYSIDWQPNDCTHVYMKKNKLKMISLRILNRAADKISLLRCKNTTLHFSYDGIWQEIIKKEPKDEKMIPGAFVDWDNTPRRKNRGNLCVGVTPEKFKKYLIQQIGRARDVYHKDYLFMFAWNEWGESAYLEPDEKYGYMMLEAVRDALIENGEFSYK